MNNKITFSKILIVFIMFLTIIIIGFSMFEMHRLQDLEALPVLITSTVAEIVGCGIFYLKKSIAENTKGGIVYDSAMCENEEDKFEAKG